MNVVLIPLRMIGCDAKQYVVLIAICVWCVDVAMPALE